MQIKPIKVKLIKEREKKPRSCKIRNQKKLISKREQSPKFITPLSKNLIHKKPRRSQSSKSLRFFRYSKALT